MCTYVDTFLHLHLHLHHALLIAGSSYHACVKSLFLFLCSSSRWCWRHYVFRLSVCLCVYVHRCVPGASVVGVLWSTCGWLLVLLWVTLHSTLSWLPCLAFWFFLHIFWYHVILHVTKWKWDCLFVYLQLSARDGNQAGGKQWCHWQ